MAADEFGESGSRLVLGKGVHMQVENSAIFGQLSFKGDLSSRVSLIGLVIPRRWRVV